MPLYQALRVRTLRADRGNFPDLRQIWPNFLKDAGSDQQFLTYDWYAAWIATYGSRAPWTGESLILVAETTNGEIAAILPLTYCRRSRLRILSMMGYPQPVRGFVCRPDMIEAATQSFAAVLRNQITDWDLLRLGPFHAEECGNATLLQQLQPGKQTPIHLARGRAIIAEQLPATFEQFQNTVLGKEFTKYIKYCDRRLSREGTVQVRHFTNPNETELKEILCDCKTVETDSWLGKVSSARFMNPIDHCFWSEVIPKSLNPNSQFDTWIMYFNQKPISFCVTFTAGARRYMIANQYNEEYKKYSTGSILYLAAFADAYQRGVTSVDFSPNDLHYKGRWGGTEHSMRIEALVFPCGLRGTIFRTLLRSYLKLRHWLDAIPGGRRITAKLPNL